MSTSFDLATIWAAILAFAIFAYVVMDGFDLGIGLCRKFCCGTVSAL
ncbi:cytochrome bd-type quinol oxidase subunit 2 [Sphingomonas sp. BE270]|jgi:cytochrome d ubiquinol oxidase subunit II|nr:cytochrome bd-type quinol oxidase subunit 2 [Sphingomonas sp. BE270]